MTTPRRTKPTLASRFARFWIVGAIVVIALAVAAPLAASSPAFRLHELDVEGNVRVPRNEIVARAAIDPSANLWLLNARAVEARVAAIPYVKTARLMRALPADARIVVTERTPDGCVRDTTGTVTVDGERRILQTGCAGAAATLYLLGSRERLRPGGTLRDPDLARLQSDAHQLSQAGRHFDELGFDRYGELEGALSNGVRVRFGDDSDLAAKERLIGPILSALGTRTEGVSAIDLRAPGTPVVERRVASAKPTPKRQVRPR